MLASDADQHLTVGKYRARNFLHVHWWQCTPQILTDMENLTFLCGFEAMEEPTTHGDLLSWHEAAAKGVASVLHRSQMSHLVLGLSNVNLEHITNRLPLIYCSTNHHDSVISELHKFTEVS